MAFGGLPFGPVAAPVDVRPAPALLPAAVDVDVRRLRLDERRVDHVRDRDRVVQRRPVEIGIRGSVPAAVEVEQLRRRLPHPPRVAELVGVRIGDEGLMGDVEPDHRRLDPALEDAARRLRVGPDVELGRRRAVSLADRAAHEHDPLRPCVRMHGEEQRHVRRAAPWARA